MAELRVGIVGMGIGRDNALGIARNPRGRVSALCDLNEARLPVVAAELPGEPKLFTDYKEMCADPEVDAVFVGTPNQLHVPVALEAVRQGKHVMCTKPLSDALAPARRLVDAQEKAGVVGMMSLSTRFDNGAQYLGRRRAEGFFGNIYWAKAISVRRSGIPDWSLGFIEAGGGAMRDMGVHVLDCAWWIMGCPQPVSVSGVAAANFGPRGQGYWDFRQPEKKFWSKYDSDDFGGGFVRFADGQGLQLESHWASHMPTTFNLELFGTEAGATMSPLRLYRTVDGAPQDLSVNLPPGPNAWDNIAAHFIACCLDGVPCEAPLRHGMVVQEMLEALLKSAQTGREVRVKGE